MAGGRKLQVSCGPVAIFNPRKQEAKGESEKAQDSIVLSMSNELLYLVPELHTHTYNLITESISLKMDSGHSVNGNTILLNLVMYSTTPLGL